ncbi:hypothetical protein M413DRAFT_11342 [Hebeloma cylindrosporum]|uniref:Ricin B lectin domain-containing protein n=1 Tax=Hebeloma cylindrosporum TaxID=76867 RepID=A0A0C3CC52_HEBCY|nr:hypothetical protein M413DRAFT_11342 [Hebeloma cylindrosporum h7]
MAEPEIKLPSDQYYIRNGELFAGRNHREDRSLLPKRVNCPTDGDLELWDLEQLPNGRYRLEARGSPTGARNNLLYAFLIDPSKAEEWIITKRKVDRNRSLYTIEKADKTAGWVKQTGTEGPQIAVLPLRVIETPDGTPQFFPNALWNIQPLVN